MTKEQGENRSFQVLCADYVLNILNQDEREMFERRLDEADEEQRRMYEQMRIKANELLFSDMEYPSLEELRELLLAETDIIEDKDEKDDDLIRAGDGDEKDVEIGSEGFSFGSVAAVVLGFICLSLFFYSLTLRSEIKSQADEIGKQSETIAVLQNQVSELQEMLAIIDSRQLYIVELLGMEANPTGYGNVVWDLQNGRAVVSISKLPVPNEGKIYHLWAIYDNKARMIASFSVDEDESALFIADGLAASANRSDFSFTVTLEAEADSPQPNGEIYLMESSGN